MLWERSMTTPARILAALAIGAVVILPAASTTASASSTASVPMVQLEPFATAPVGASKPDDITMLDGLVYVTYQNHAGKDGTPPGSKSTIAVFSPFTGHLVTTYSLLGRCDGLTADPAHHRLLASVNEDLNSSLYVITPGNANPIAHYTYSPSPAETGTDGTNGGTDAISVGLDGTIYIAHSNPDQTLPYPSNTAAVYTVTLGGETAHLTPLFGINDFAQIVNPAPGGPLVAPLGLTDPDSNRLVGGMLIQVSQADSKLVLVTHLHDGPVLRQLNLTNAGQPSTSTLTPQLDDVAPVFGPGSLFVVDQATGSIYTVDTAGLAPGTFFASQPAPSSGDLPNTPALSVVDIHTGVVTPVNTSLGSPKGLLFVPFLP